MTKLTWTLTLRFCVI